MKAAASLVYTAYGPNIKHIMEWMVDFEWKHISELIDETVKINRSRITDTFACDFLKVSLCHLCCRLLLFCFAETFMLSYESASNLMWSSETVKCVVICSHICVLALWTLLPWADHTPHPDLLGQKSEIFVDWFLPMKLCKIFYLNIYKVHKATVDIIICLQSGSAPSLSPRVYGARTVVGGVALSLCKSWHLRCSNSGCHSCCTVHVQIRPHDHADSRPRPIKTLCHMQNLVQICWKLWQWRHA